MQLDTITELLQIPGYKVRHMVSCTGNRIELLLEREGERARVCSGCGKVHTTAVHSEGSVLLEDLPISGKELSGNNIYILQWYGIMFSWMKQCYKENFRQYFHT